MRRGHNFSRSGRQPIPLINCVSAFQAYRRVATSSSADQLGEVAELFSLPESFAQLTSEIISSDRNLNGLQVNAELGIPMNVVPGRAQAECVLGQFSTFLPSCQLRVPMATSSITQSDRVLRDGVTDTQLHDAGQEFPRAELQPGLEYDLLSMFVRNELSGQAAILLLAAVFSLVSMFWAPWTEAVIWLFLVIAAKVVLLDCCYRFLRTPSADINVPVWRRRLIIAEALSGLAWAGFVFVGFNGIETLSQGYLVSSNVFVFTSLIIVLAIRVTFASTVMPLLYVGTVPMTLAVVTRFALLGDVLYLALAAMAIGVHAYLIVLAKGLRRTSLAMLELRAEKDELIARLEEARAISDEARRRAEAASAAKSRFLATMSHELRTPLNAILGFSEVMAGEVLGPLQNPTYKEYADDIHASGRHLLHLINEILDLSRIEAGRYQLNEEPVTLEHIVEECCNLMELKTRNKDIRIVQQFESSLPRLYADERSLRQITLNLLSNAVKFAPTGSEVRVRIGWTAGGGQYIAI